MNPLLQADGRIEDDELRAIFHSESEEHLQGLDAGLLLLESDLTHAATLQALFRHAHNLKGTARMLGLEDLGSIAHHFEDVLGAAQRGELQLTIAKINTLYQHIDPMRRLALAAVTGEPAGVDAAIVLAELQVGTGTNVSDQTQAQIQEPEAASSPAQPVATPTPAPTPVPAAASAPVPAALPAPQETIRVSSQKLDALMTQVGELVVTNIRLTQRMAEMDELVSAWEDLSRPRHPGSQHDGVLGPAFAPSQGDLAQFGKRIVAMRDHIHEGVDRLNQVVDGLEEEVRAVRLVPIFTLFGFFPRMVRELSRELNKSVELVIEGGEIEVDKRIVEELKDPLMHMLRNAVDHGIESPAQREERGKPPTARLILRARQTAAAVVIEVVDDGRGLDAESIRRTALHHRMFTQDQLAAMSDEQVHQLVFHSGFSTSPVVTDLSGRGVGMDVVQVNVSRLKGQVQVASSPGRGTTVRMVLPLSLASVRCLTVRAGQRVYALPIDQVDQIHVLPQEAIYPMAGRPTAQIGGEAVSLARLTDLLDLPDRANPAPQATGHFCVVLAVEGNRLGLLVDGVNDEQELVLKPLNGLLRRVRNVAGATILGDGSVSIVLNPHDLIRSALSQTGSALDAPASDEEVAEAPPRHRLLLAEDSITTRTQVRRILEQAGYEVVVAVDGLDGWDKLTGSGPFHALVTDVEMPRLDGFGLISRVRQNQAWADLPVILVTSLATDADKRRGIEVGANAYLVKSTFDQKVLLDTLRRLL